MTPHSHSATVDEVGLGCWTILDETSDEVRATVTRESECYSVRDETGEVVGEFPTAQLALASVVA